MDKKYGSKNAISKMIFYYMIELQENGDKDPQKTVATELPDLIGLSKEQADFVLKNIDDDFNSYKDIKNAIKLIKTNNKESIELGIALIEEVIKPCNDIVKEQED